MESEDLLIKCISGSRNWAELPAEEEKPRAPGDVKEAVRCEGEPGLYLESGPEDSRARWRVLADISGRRVFSLNSGSSPPGRQWRGRPAAGSEDRVGQPQVRDGPGLGRWKTSPSQSPRVKQRQTALAAGVSKNLIIICQPGPLSLVQECRGLALIGRELHSGEIFSWCCYAIGIGGFHARKGSIMP